MSKSWKIAAVDLFLRIYTRCGSRLKNPVTLSTMSEFNHIVIYSTTALGDLMFNTPAIRAIRQRFPSAMITLVAHKKFCELLDQGKDWNRVVYWDNKIKSLFSLLRELNQQTQPELAILLHSHEPYDYLSAIMAGAHYVLRDNYYDHKKPRDRWLAACTRSSSGGHLIQRKLTLAGQLGCNITDTSMHLPVTGNAPSRQGKVRLIGFQMGASTPERCWPPEYFAIVANYLLQHEESCRIVLIGGPGDKLLAESFYQHLDCHLHEMVVNKIGKTGLPELIDTINHMTLLLTGDTGPLHVAIAAKIPTLSLFVTASPYVTGPYQDRHLHDFIHVEPDETTSDVTPLMKLIKPTDVVDALQKKLIDICKKS